MIYRTEHPRHTTTPPKVREVTVVEKWEWHLPWGPTPATREWVKHRVLIIADTDEAAAEAALGELYELGHPETVQVTTESVWVRNVDTINIDYATKLKEVKV